MFRTGMRTTSGKPIPANNTKFIIPREGAQDLGRYDFLADLMRLESMVSKEPNLTGYAILLTNEPRYWDTPANPPKTKDRSSPRVKESSLFSVRFIVNEVHVIRHISEIFEADYLLN